ncbi:MAG: FAD-binding oxidoreductase [marine bacterium B5-7]|nr:MAG: FAD-binding oxidoreductase [marine bacterium B5-7]
MNLTYWHDFGSNSALRNWSNTDNFTPILIASPENLDELSFAIEEAVANNIQITLRGSGHSFRTTSGKNILLLPEGNIVIDEDRCTVSADAGTKLGDIIRALDNKGLTLINLGDIDKQTVMGALATATHGTGAGFGAFPTQVTSLEIFTAGNQRITATPNNEHSELFHMSLVPGGVFAAIGRVTLKARKSYNLQETKQGFGIDEALSRLNHKALLDQYTLMCWPHSNLAAERIWKEVGRTSDSWLKRKFNKYFNQYFMENFLLGRLAKVVEKFPSLAKGFSHVVAKGAARGSRIDNSFNILTHPRTTLSLYEEAEYELPLENAEAAMRELTDLIIDKNIPSIWPLFLRVVKADSFPMSPFNKSHSQTEVYVSISILLTIGEISNQEYLADATRILLNHGGRPHWGKISELDSDKIESLYPQFSDYKRIISEYDEGNTFSSEFFDRLF